LNHFAVLRIISVIVGVALTVLSFYISYKHERQQIYQKFVSEVDSIGASLELAVGRKIEVLASYRGFYETFGYTTEDGFEALTRNNQSFHPEIVAIKWAPLVRHSDRESFVEKVRIETSHPDYEITERIAGGESGIALEREEYYPIMYSVPETHTFPLGYDLASEIQTRTALQIAQWNDEPITSHPVKLGYEEISRGDNGGSVGNAGNEENEGQAKSNQDIYSYVISVPVFNPGWKSADDKPEYLAAFVLGLLDINTIFQEVIENDLGWDEMNAIALENLTGGDAVLDRVAALPGSEIDQDTSVHYQKKLAAIADLQWFLIAKPSKKYFAKHRSYYPYVLCLGLFIFTVLIEAYLRVLARMDKELQEMARVDGLTNVANRRRFFDQIKKEWSRAQRFGRPISVFIIDVDNFKKYNDNYGHLEGDRCLKEVAAELQAHVNRPADLLARYGGEEFAVLLPETSLDDARQVAEKCRAGIESLQIPHEQNESWGVVTISVGVAMMVPDKHNKFGKLLEQADKVMYMSKEGGRNKVSVAKKNKGIASSEDAEAENSKPSSVV